jgi:large subunit ribosomal protein L16
VNHGHHLPQGETEGQVLALSGAPPGKQQQLPNQIEAARKVAMHHVGKTGKIWIRVFPDHPFTQKPAEVKMGKGKGDPVGFVAEVKPGRIVFEIDGVEPKVAAEALRKAGTKLPVKTKIINRV